MKQRKQTISLNTFSWALLVIPKLNSIMVKRICIVGSGPSGLACIKSCLEEGLDVVSYDKSDFIGGLWYYHDEDVDGVASVARSTIINTSKEMSAYSDFPPPGEFPNYMHNSKMVSSFNLL